ncbi:MAG: hypothetical protein ABIL16_06710 [candidate division WOR-3 bacterium]
MIWLVFQVEIYPQQVFSFAEELYSEGKYREAALEFLRFITLFPNSDSVDYAHFMAGYSYKLANLLDFAEEIFKRHIVENKRGKVWAHYELAKIYLYKGDTFKFYEELSKMPDNSVQKKSLVAWMRLQEGDWKEAKRVVAGTVLERYIYDPDLKSPKKAAFLSIIPGFGRYWLGDRGTALMGAFMVGTFYVLGFYYKFREKRDIPAYASFGVGVAFHAGQIYGSYAFAKVINRERWRELLENYSRAVEKYMDPKYDDFFGNR